MKRIKKIFLSTLLFCFSYSAMAWGLTGHRVIGAIAESYLTAKAKMAVSAILGNESIAMSANWADFIKSDSTFNYLSPWHYFNIDQGKTKSEFMNLLRQDTATDAYTKINFLIKELKNKQLPGDKKLMYLRLLIHIVGDIHEPLHVGQFDDLGGNRVKVTWFGEASNLHSVWDEKLIESQKLSYTEYSNAINYTASKQRREWQKQPLSEWLFESYQIAGQLYNGITQPDQRLSYRYNFENLEILNQRLLKAGVRLAGILNQIFA
ncbi:MAG: S1/P1 nuclease [Bacteroidia bacterium]|nr:S1/P1 nuclease [Bacteroidia bacterium]